MKRNTLWRRRLIAALIVAAVVGAGAAYVSDYYRADASAIAAFSQDGAVSQTPLDGAIAYGTGEETAAFIFYPGGKVEHTAYEPLMRALAEHGVLCVAVEMPLHLAVLDVHAAADIRAAYPVVERWYIGGHSLGGSMAASHLAANPDRYRGLVLLGAYSIADLSQGSAAVLSVYGSEDRVMNREKYDRYQSNLPADTTEVVIDGGCHAYFGMYGEQAGDGEATIPAAQQIRMTASHIAAFIEGE